ncbi:hypothetical protein BLGI_2420 [Brevibacillus laterosporus GI-9]|nr:hypothetical protein BLGI_2420 [Brevibacillus laterosporus GI-9]
MDYTPAGNISSGVFLLLHSFAILKTSICDKSPSNPHLFVSSQQGSLGGIVV